MKNLYFSKIIHSALTKLSINKLFNFKSKNPYEILKDKRYDLKKIKFEPNLNKKVILESKKKYSKGWYLFGIKHEGKNNSCYCKLFTGESYFYQGRPTFPLKRRWRTVHINRSNKLNIILENIENPFILKEIWFIKIPFFNAWMRIRKRCKQFNTFTPSIFVSNNQFLKFWRIYNLELTSQCKSLKSHLFIYDQWQEKIEFNILKKILQKKSKEFIFDIQNPENPLPTVNSDYVITLNNEDKLPEWIFSVLKILLNQASNPQILFGDEDFIDEFGKRSNPKFKGAWNRELFWCNFTINNSWIIKSSLWNKAIIFLKRNNYIVNKFSIICYLTYYLEKNNDLEKIKHIPLILYHNLINKRKKILQNYLINKNFLYEFIRSNKSDLGNCKFIKTSTNKSILKLFWQEPSNAFLSIIIPTRDKVDYLKRCIDSILENGPGIPFEIIIIDNDSKEEKTILYLKNFISRKDLSFSRRVIKFDGKFNYSRMNNYVTDHANGNVLVFVNNDIEFISKKWGQEFASNAFRPGIGFVGAKLLYSNNTIQHAGVILGIGGVAGHAFKFINENEEGYFSRIDSPQEYSALTAACLAISKKNWNKLNGFNEKHLPVNYNDVDICLEARLIGLRNLYLPSVKAYHHESITRGRLEGKRLRLWKKESAFLKRKWASVIDNDPSYSPYLTYVKEDFSKVMKIPNKFVLRDCLIKSKK